MFTVKDYVHTILPSALVAKALPILAEVNDRQLDAFTLALEMALDLDHRHVSLAKIAAALGDLGHGDALLAIADRLEGGALVPRALLDAWDSWAKTVTGRSSLEGVTRDKLRCDIAANLVEAPAVRRERDALLAAVRAATGDPRMTVESSIAWLSAKPEPTGRVSESN